MSYTFLTVFARARDFRVKNLEFKQKLEVYTKIVWTQPVIYKNRDETCSLQNVWGYNLSYSI